MGRIRRKYGGWRVVALLAIVLALTGSMVAADLHQVAAAQTTENGAAVDVTAIDPGALGDALTGDPVFAYIGIAGVVISFATSVLTKATWAKEVKLAVASTLYVAAGVGYWAVEKWQTTEAVLTVLGIATVALVWYRLNHGAMDELNRNHGVT